MNELPSLHALRAPTHSLMPLPQHHRRPPCRWVWLQMALEFVAVAAMCVVMMAGLLAQVSTVQDPHCFPPKNSPPQ